MFFQFSRFWQNYGFASQLDTLLERSDVTLEQILDEDNILMELKNSGAQKFAKFLTSNPENFEKAIEYVISYEEDSKDPKRNHKYPFVVSEALSVENADIINFLFDKEEEQKEEQEQVAKEEDQEEMKQKEATINEEHEKVGFHLLNKLFGFLDQDCLNVTSAGYFAKVVLPLIRKRGYDVWQYLQDHPNVISNMIKHVDVVHVADLMEKLIILHDQPEDTFLHQRQTLLSRLLNVCLNKSYQPAVVENIAQILNEIILRGKDSAQLIEIINKPNKIFQFGVVTQSSTVFQLLINLLDYIRQKGNNRRQDDDVANFDEDDSDVISYSNFYEICKDIPPTLQSKNVLTPNFDTTYGTRITPVTASKLTLLQLLHSLLQTGDSIIIENVFSTNIFGVLKHLLLSNPFNNQLQIAFERFVTLIFESDTYKLLQQKLITEQLLEFIVQHNSQQSTKLRPGYHGVLTKISNLLVQKSSTNPLLQTSNNQWHDYVRNVLSQINKVESQYLCGINPKAKSDYDDDADVQRIFEHRFPSGQNQQQQPKETEQEEQPAEEVEEEFHDAQEVTDENQQKNNEQRRNSSSSEEEIQEEINKVIHSPNSQPQEISELIEIQEKLELNSHSLPPEQIEAKSDAEVISYWKHHEEKKEQIEEQEVVNVQEPQEQELNKQEETEESKQPEEEVTHEDEPVPEVQEKQPEETTEDQQTQDNSLEQQ